MTQSIWVPASWWRLCFRLPPAQTFAIPHLSTSRLLPVTWLLLCCASVIFSLHRLLKGNLPTLLKWLILQALFNSNRTMWARWMENYFKGPRLQSLHCPVLQSICRQPRCCTCISLLSMCELACLRSLLLWVLLHLLQDRPVSKTFKLQPTHTIMQHLQDSSRTGWQLCQKIWSTAEIKLGLFSKLNISRPVREGYFTLKIINGCRPLVYYLAWHWCKMSRSLSVPKLKRECASLTDASLQLRCH